MLAKQLCCHVEDVELRICDYGRCLISTIHYQSAQIGSHPHIATTPLNGRCGIYSPPPREVLRLNSQSLAHLSMAAGRQANARLMAHSLADIGIRLEHNGAHQFRLFAYVPHLTS